MEWDVFNSLLEGWKKSYSQAEEIQGHSVQWGLQSHTATGARWVAQTGDPGQVEGEGDG